MFSLRRMATGLSTAALITGLAAGCSQTNKGIHMGDITPNPLGTHIDPMLQTQETNAEASDFVIHEHEWNGESAQLNAAGLDHFNRIRQRAETVPFPIVVQPSSMSVDPNSLYGYPVNGNSQLDLARRQAVVAALAQTGMPGAESRVIVAPALTPGFEGFEAQQAYQRGLSGRGNGFGGGFGGAGLGGGGFGGGIGF